MIPFLTLALVTIAMVHVAWGLRIWIPIREEARLARAVVGAQGVTQMPPPLLCFGVAGALGLVAVALAMLPSTPAWLLLWCAAPVFILRGALAYVPAWRRLTPEEPFATNDRHYFGPLCAAIGVGLVIVLQRGV